MKIVFWGSDDFALAYLEKLYQSGHAIVACVTQPDKPKGRGLAMAFSPIKEFALKHDLPVLQPENFKNEGIVTDLKKFDADLFVVIAYGKILTSEILMIPKVMSINVHGSLLPKYRGAAPINWAIINGEKSTGLSVILMSPLLDAGDILAQEKYLIEDKDTSESLRRRMIAQGPDFLLNTIENIKQGKISKIKQLTEEVTKAPKLTKELGRIDWRKSAIEIHNLVRGLLPWPSAYGVYHGKTLKILESEVDNNSHAGASPGQVISIEKESFSVATGKGVLKVKKVHLDSSKPMDAKAFLLGHEVKIGEMLV